MAPSIGSLALLVLIVWGVVRLLAYVRRLFTRRKEAERISSLCTSITCPTCHGPLSIEQMLDASVFFGPGAIVFDCPHCHGRVYFAPYEPHIETGILAASPVVDPIPLEQFGYPKGFDMQSNIENGVLNICIGERSWNIRKAGEFPQPS